MAEKSDSPDDMVFTVRANVPNDFTSELPLDGKIDCYVDWGDGSVDYYNSKPVKHTYSSDAPASYVVRISGKVTRLDSGNIRNQSIVEVNQWGKTGLNLLQNAFYNNSLLVKVAGCRNDELAEVTDEIHRLSPVVEEYLYSAMEQFAIDILIDKGPYSYCRFPFSSRTLFPFMSLCPAIRLVCISDSI